jgi:hypothetical protein
MKNICTEFVSALVLCLYIRKETGKERELKM